MGRGRASVKTGGFYGTLSLIANDSASALCHPVAIRGM